MCRVLFPDVVLGAGYVPEELGAEVTETGDVLEAEIVDDQDFISISEAKHSVLEAVGGNKEEAKAVWATEYGDEKNISRTSVSDLLDRLSLKV